MKTIDFNVSALSELGVTSFMLTGNPTSETEFNEMFRKITGADDNDRAILSDDPADFGVTWSQLLTKRNELEAAEHLKLLREERDAKLAETDWWMLSDTATATQAQLDYRQALRDITNTYTSLDTVVWPTKP